MQILEPSFVGEPVSFDNERFAYLDAEEIPSGLGLRHTEKEAPPRRSDIDMQRPFRITKNALDIDRLRRLPVVRRERIYVLMDSYPWHYCWRLFASISIVATDVSA